MILDLPWPPSGNTYKRHRALPNGVIVAYLTARAKAFMAEAVLRVRTARGEKPAGRLRVTLEIFPPTRRKFDLDNAAKCVLDSLQQGGAIRDDADIDDLRILRLPVERGGRVRVTVEGIE